MKSRTLLILCLAASTLAAKSRAWQTGQLLDKAMNPYFHTASTSNSGGTVATNSSTFVAGDNGMLASAPKSSNGDVTYENYVVQGPDAVYLVEYAHFKSFPQANVSINKPVSFAVEKNKLIILDLDRHEFETTILKQVDRQGTAVATTAPAPAPAAKSDASKPEQAKPERAKAEPVKAEPAKAEPSKVELAKVEPTKAEQPKPQQARVEQPKVEKTRPATVKTDDVFTKSAFSKDDVNPPKAKAVQPQAPKPEPKVEASLAKAPAKPEPKVEAPVAKPAAKVEPKAEAAVTKAPAKPEPKAETKPEGPVVRASTKDRAWQSGQLLSVANNNYFFNVTYTSDTEGSAWPFSQGSDGRLTVTGQIAGNTSSPYTYDNYVIESEYVAYLVQRMRPKTSAPVRLPGTKALKFAVDKGKMWVVDDQGIEYETKVIKLIQKDAIVDPLTRAAAR